MAHIITPDGQIKAYGRSFTADGKTFCIEHYGNDLFAYDASHEDKNNYVFDWYAFLDFWIKETNERMNGYSHKNQEYYLEVKKNVSKGILGECMVTFCEKEYKSGNYKIEVG